MMNHTDGWMGGWGSGGMWLWAVIGVVVVALLVVVISKLSRK
jgi:anti-sigma-K factor RskA